MKLHLLITALTVFAARLAADASPTDPLPGTVLTLEFPELGKMHHGLDAACEVSIPRDYAPGKPSPLLVWLSGGRGSHLVANAHDLVDSDKFVVVALPYPDGKDVRAAAKDGTLEAHWEFQRAMLERVRERVPNIDPALRVVAGTSNGGHLIGFALDRAWPGVADYFTAFVIHEGGMQPVANDIPNAKDKQVLVVYGQKSPSIVWSGWFCWNLQRSGALATFIALPDSAHGLGPDGRAAINHWIGDLVAKHHQH